MGRGQGRGAVLRVLACAAWAGLSGALSVALGETRAGEGFALMGVGGGFGGVLGGALGGGRSDGLHGYAGVIYAPAHSLSDSGLLLRAWGKAFEFSYETDLPGEPDVRIDALGYGVQLEAGWQIAGPWGRAALLPGLVWRDHELDPSDPGSRLESGRFGLSLTVDGEWRFGDRFGIMANATYLTGFDDFWVQTRPFVDLGHGWKAGLDLAGWGGPDYDKMRAGVFTSGYELPFTGFGRLFLGGAAGIQSDMDGKRLAPFGGIDIGVLF